MGLLVKPKKARQQLEAEVPSTKGGSTTGASDDGSTTTGGTGGTGDVEGSGDTPPAPQLPRRFHGAVQLDPTRVGRDAGKIAEEVIAHLTGQVGAEVSVTLEIEAMLPDGASDQIVRTVTENSRTLKFTSQGFERE